jgi:hypothetical protein
VKFLAREPRYLKTPLHLILLKVIAVDVLKGLEPRTRNLKCLLRPAFIYLCFNLLIQTRLLRPIYSKIPVDPPLCLCLTKILLTDVEKKCE